MISAHTPGSSRILPLTLGFCVLLAVFCMPAHAEAGSPGTVPASLKIVIGEDEKHPLRLSAAAADTPAAPDVLWKFAIFWDGAFYGRTAIPAVDGGYLIAGESRVGGTEESAQGAAVVITEPVNGNTTAKWALLYGTDGTYDSFSDVTPDGNGYVFAGSSKTFNPPQPDGWILHTDAGGWGDGTTYWQRSWPYTDGQYPDRFNGITRSADGGFAMAGTTGSYHPDVTTSDVWLIRMDSTGATTGSGAYDGTVPKIAEKIRSTSDGGFILAGSSTPAGSPGTKLLLIRLNADNSVRWQKEFGSNPSNGAYDVRETSDGGFIAAGYTTDASGHKSMYLVKTDAGGNPAWEATPASSRPDAEGHGVVETDNGFLVAGSSAGALVVKVDHLGNTQWENVYLTQNPDSSVTSLEKTSDGGFLIGGTRVQADEPAPGFQIIKLGPEKTVQQPIALPGMNAVPTDPDQDGIYEDVNANGRMDFGDVVEYFNQMDWIAANEPVGLFDLNGNGRIDFGDVVLLFEEV